MTAFKKIYIEITNRCNLACPFCIRSRRAPAAMAPEVFAAILERIRGFTRHLALHVLGEPLLHPQLALLLELCREQGMQVNLTTNGTLLTPHRSLLLQAPALRQVNISLQALAAMEEGRAMSCLDELVDFAQEAGRRSAFWLSLRLWILHHEPDPVREARVDWLLGRLGAAFAVPGLAREALRAGRGIALATRIFLNPEASFTWPDPSAPERGRWGFCRGLRDHLAILVDGTVAPCCLDGEGRLALGNLLEQPLAAILEGGRARRMREGFGHQRLVEPLCRRCTYRLRFERQARAGIVPDPNLSP